MKYLRNMAGLVALMIMTGCGTLAPNGAYQGDTLLYRADTLIVLSYDVMHQFVTFEYQNRAGLTGTPEIKQAADKIRAGAKSWIGSAIALREAYAAHPGPATADQLQKALSILQAACTESTKYLTQFSVKLSPEPKPPTPK